MLAFYETFWLLQERPSGSSELCTSAADLSQKTWNSPHTKNSPSHQGGCAQSFQGCDALMKVYAICKGGKVAGRVKNRD